MDTHFDVRRALRAWHADDALLMQRSDFGLVVICHKTAEGDLDFGGALGGPERPAVPRKPEPMNLYTTMELHGKSLQLSGAAATPRS